jgi:hypothetical protein
VAFAEDISVFFSATEFAVQASFTPSAGGAAQVANVILDSPTDDIFGGDGNSTEYKITYPVTALIGIRKGDSGTVNGLAFRVRGEPRLLDDGRLKAAVLTKV